MGRHVVRRFLLPHYISLDFPQWTVHEATSCSVADSIWLQRALFDGVAVLAFPKLSDGQANPGVGRSRPGVLPYRHGQGVRRQLLRCQHRKDLESPRCVRAGSFSRMDFQSRSHSSSRHPLGHQHYVGSNGDRIRSPAAEFH